MNKKISDECKVIFFLLLKLWGKNIFSFPIISNNNNNRIQIQDDKQEKQFNDETMTKDRYIGFYSILILEKLYCFNFVLEQKTKMKQENPGIL